MLYKSILLNYRRSLDGQSNPNQDMIGSMIDKIGGRAFRESAFDMLKDARVFVLDENAARYIDSFRDDLRDYKFDEDGDDRLNQHISNIDVPEDLVWVEFNLDRLNYDQVQREYHPSKKYQENSFGHRGILLDNRDPKKASIMLFCSVYTGEILDPIVVASYRKDESGRIKFTEPEFSKLDHVVSFFCSGRNVPRNDPFIIEILRSELEETQYDMQIPYLLFSLMNSIDNGISISQESAVSEKEIKTARKFGKDWVEKSLRTHNVVRVGPEALAHLKEVADRKKFERENKTTHGDRNAPVEHWVSEHERVCKSGKIALVKSHKRGQAPDPTLPTLVKGPAKNREKPKLRPLEEDDGPSF